MRVKTRKLVAILIILLSIPSVSVAQDPYSREVCKQIYDAIGTFLAVADAGWKSQDEEKALKYSTAAANYATIYETFCKPE